MLDVIIAAAVLSVGETEMKTYPFSDPDPIPATAANRYPYFRYDGSSPEGVCAKWKTVTLENERIRVVMLPEVGGKIHSATDKKTGNDFLYVNHVMKFRDIAMRGPWVSGGIEFNFGIIGHAPSSSTPVDWFTRANADGSVSCFVSSPEYITRTVWQVEVRLGAEADEFETRVTWYNASGLPAPYYHWMNAAYSVRGNPEFLFPGRVVIGHQGEIETERWPYLTDLNRKCDTFEGNAWGGPKSYHVLPGHNGFYGIWWPQKGFGSYHRSEPYEKFGRKIWLWALSREGGIWEDLLTDGDGQYTELQSGRCFNQPRYGNYKTPFKHPVFAPGSTETFVEHWGPVRARGEIAADIAPERPLPKTRPIRPPADFDWSSAWGEYVRGTQLLAERHDQDGAVHLRAAIAKDRFFAPAYAALAGCELRRGDYRAVHELCEKALAINAYDGLAGYLDGFAYFVEGDQVTARERLGVASLQPQYRSAALALVARGYLRTGDGTAAFAAAQKALAANPLNADALLAAAIALRGQGEAQRAFLTAALEKLPLMHALRYEQARAAGGGFIETALPRGRDAGDFGRFIANELPHETYLELGSWYEETGCADDARRLFARAGESILAKVRLGDWAAAKRLKVAGAFPFRREDLPALEKAVSADGHWKFRYLLAVLKQSFGFKADAAKLLAACGDEPDEPVFYQYRASVGEDSAALADLRRAKRLGDSWRLGRQFVEAYEKAGDCKAMLATTTEYIAKYPKCNPLQIAHGRALLKTKRYRACLDYLKGVVLLPSEHRDSGTAIWQEAQKALGLELTWPENLGQGKPYPKEPVGPVRLISKAKSGIDLSGEWTVELGGARATVTLPGTLADAGLGERWTRERFERTGKEGPTCDRPQSGALTREYQHLGVATYVRDFDVTAAEANRPLELVLERVMWASEATLDGRKIGACDSLSTPHVYRVGPLAAGRHTLRIAVDNSCRYGFSRNSHSYGPSGQSVWHGIIGRIGLRPVDPFASVRIAAPSPDARRVVVSGLPEGFSGTVSIEGLSAQVVRRERGRVTLALSEEPVGWSEETPRLYTLVLDGSVRKPFGFHSYGTVKHAITVNGVKTFLRANIDNCLFPKFGRPPMTKDEWRAILRVLKEEDGFNAIRFHSWCPPEAAFAAADELGVYLQPEVCIWSDRWMKPAPQHVGWGESVDGFVHREFRAICDAYGNHPSFLSLAVGNELGGSNWDEAERIVQAMRAYEPRVLHFFSSARKIVPSDQLMATHRIPGFDMCRERLFPNTDWDYEELYSKTNLPVLAHEIGQWPTYPDFATLLPKFDGVMRPWNIERCAVRARNEGTDRFAREYSHASARMSRLMYKDEVESFLRTPSCAGLHVLDAQDYTGEGEALMGWRDPFFALKPMYRDLPPFRVYWGREAALARFAKYDWCVGETFEAKLLVRNLTRSALPAGKAYAWSIASAGETLARGELKLAQDLAPDELAGLGTVRLPIAASRREKLVLACGENAWSFWAFPREDSAPVPEGVTMTDDFKTLRRAIAAGGTVLYTGASRETALDTFKPVYWSSSWFPSRQPLKETLGTWFEKDHPMLAAFPTESSQDWQWYGLVGGARIHRLTGLPRTFRPVALSVNDFHYSMLASSLFELKVGRGRLVVCGYDLEKGTPAAKRLRASVFAYLNRPPAEGTISVPQTWLDTAFAPVGEERISAGDVVYSEAIGFRGRTLAREVRPGEPVTATVELVFDRTDAECSGRGSIDGHAFELPPGKERRLVRVGIIREDALDGRLSLRFEAAGQQDVILHSLRIIR